VDLPVRRRSSGCSRRPSNGATRPKVGLNAVPMDMPTLPAPTLRPCFPSPHAEHYADELEEELDDALLQDFNVEAEDNSPAEVSKRSASPRSLFLTRTRVRAPRMLMLSCVCVLQVAQAMVQLYQECARGDTTMLQRLRAQAAPQGASGSRRQVVSARRERLRSCSLVMEPAMTNQSMLAQRRSAACAPINPSAWRIHHAR